MSNDPSQTRESGIMTQSDILNEKADLLRETVKGLEQKISPVLSQASQDPGKQQGSSSDCPLWQALLTLGDRLESISDKLNDLQARVQL